MGSDRGSVLKDPFVTSGHRNTAVPINAIAVTYFDIGYCETHSRDWIRVAQVSSAGRKMDEKIGVVFVGKGKSYD